MAAKGENFTPTMQIGVAVFQETGKRPVLQSIYTTLEHTPKESVILWHRDNAQLCSLLPSS